MRLQQLAWKQLETMCKTLIFHGITSVNQDDWCDISIMCCGNNQSPIPLGKEEMKKSLIPMPAFNFLNHDISPKSVTMLNDGHTLMIQFEYTLQLELTSGGLLDRYTFSNLHFHWGSNDFQGSEHTIKNNRAPLEMHLVYFSSKFTNLTSARASMKSDAIAVLAVLFHIDDNNINPSLEK
uniref:carbonic anhydrase n=1 Tax=Strigamia maritima TaxID=126957 RepID=T1IRA3_STRMM